MTESSFKKISIVTPSFNQGRYLADTIESVISQEGEFYLDYIIMDGGSTDSSVDIIRRYDGILQRGDWPIRCRGISYRWTSARDNGQSEALAKGFLMADGEILAWLNSDDTYVPGALRNASNFFCNHPEAGLLYGDANFCDQRGTILGRYRTEEFSLEKLACFNIICQPSAFFTRKAFDAVGGVDESLHFAMDLDLWVRIGRRFPCGYLPEIMSAYRLHAESKTLREETLIQNFAETLMIAQKHFGWAPLNRVYNLCNSRCRGNIPAVIKGNRLIVVPATIIYAICCSLWLNRGVNRRDLKLFNADNFRKLFKNRLDISITHGGE